MGRGKLIVVEGLDNVGKTTFVQYFLKQNPLVIPRKFPSESIAETMNSIKYADINWDLFHDLFHKDLQDGINDIEKFLASGISVICDRYIYSHFVYERLRCNMAEDDVGCFFETPVKPDIIIYLRPKFPERLQVNNEGKDNLEYGIDYVKGQKEFDRIFAKTDNVVIIPALEWNTNDEAIKSFHLILGVFV